VRTAHGVTVSVVPGRMLYGVEVRAQCRDTDPPFSRATDRRRSPMTTRPASPKAHQRTALGTGSVAFDDDF
jgi:hypothetical protein